MKGAATQSCSPAFDRVFFGLPPDQQRRLEEAIDRMGMRLADYPHLHAQGVDAYRLRVGDHRVIYRFDLSKNLLFLGALGHRRQIYR